MTPEVRDRRPSAACRLIPCDGKTPGGDKLSHYVSSAAKPPSLLPSSPADPLAELASLLRWNERVGRGVRSGPRDRSPESSRPLTHLSHAAFSSSLLAETRAQREDLQRADLLADQGVEGGPLSRSGSVTRGLTSRAVPGKLSVSAWLARPGHLPWRLY